MATSDYVQQEVKGLKKSFDNSVDMSILSMGKIKVFTMNSTNEYTELYTSTEGLSGTRKLGEFETPDSNALQEGFSTNIADDRYGNSIEVSSTDRRKFKDSTVKVREYLTRQRNALLLDIKYTLVENLSDFLNDAVAGAKYLAPDGVALLGTHSWNTDGSDTWNNKTTAKLTQDSVDEAVKFGANFKGGDGKRWVQTYNTVVVKTGSENARNAKRLFAEGITATQINDINIYEGGTYTIIETPFIDEANEDFWFMFDLKKHPSPLYMGIGEAPSMQEPILEKNLAVYSAVEGFWKQGIINQPFNVYGGDGSA